MNSILREKEETDLEPVWSMANFRKHASGLPVNIWLDEGEIYKRGGYGKRIKFQRDRGERASNTNLAVMTISDNPEVIGDHELSGKDIQAIKDFVLRNKEALEQLSDMEIGITDFLKIMV